MCNCSQSFPSVWLLSSAVALRFLGRHPVKICEPEVWQKYTKKLHFEESLCYIAFKKMIRSQKGELRRISSPGGSFQNQFSTATTKAAVKSRIIWFPIMLEKGWFKMQPGKTPGQEALQRMQKQAQQQQLQIQQDNMKQYWWWQRNKERELQRQSSAQPAGEKKISWETKNIPYNYPVSQPKSRWFLGSIVFLIGAGLSLSSRNPLIFLVGLVITIIISRKVWRGKKR